MAFAVSDSTHATGYRYFSAHGCVFVEGSRRSVFVGGALVGSYDLDDKAMRNAILVKLSEAPKVHLGHLADAFELTQEQVRRLRRQYETNGLSGVTQIKHGGRVRVVTPALRRKLYELFDAGASIDLAHTKIKARISRTMVGRTRKVWRLERELEASSRAAVQTAESAAPAGGQLEFDAALIQNVDAELAPQTPVEVEPAFADDALDVGAAATEISAPPSSEAGLSGGSSLHGAEEVSSELFFDAKKQYVQHAGAFIVLALVQTFGLYRHAEKLRKDAVDDGDADRRYLGKTALRVALDAAIIALVMGQKCIEGVRRVATPSAKILLRILSPVPSESWVRGVLGRFAHARGGLSHPKPPQSATGRGPT